MTCALITGTAVAGGAPAFAQAQVIVAAKGTIAPSCSLSSTGNFPASNYTYGGTAAAAASVSCNQFFKVTAMSANGAIKTSTPALGQFANSLIYSLKADLALDDGGISTADCPSDTLTTGKSSCSLSPASGLTSGGHIATSKIMNLTLRWGATGAATKLVPGSYSDTITLTIATIP